MPFHVWKYFALLILNFDLSSIDTPRFYMIKKTLIII